MIEIQNVVYFLSLAIECLVPSIDVCDAPFTSSPRHLVTSSLRHGLLNINPPGSAVPQASWWYRRAQQQDSSNGMLGRWGLQARNIDSVDFPRR